MSPSDRIVSTSRRTLLKASTAAAAAAIGVFAGDNAMAQPRFVNFPGLFRFFWANVYYLDPNCGGSGAAFGGATSSSCSTCRACRNHAAAKRWPTAEAVRRAHPNCDCTVRVMKVPRPLFAQMFGAGVVLRPEYDLRSRRRTGV
jgi:hypothetical protein